MKKLIITDALGEYYGIRLIPGKPMTDEERKVNDAEWKAAASTPEEIRQAFTKMSKVDKAAHFKLSKIGR